MWPLRENLSELLQTFGDDLYDVGVLRKRRRNEVLTRMLSATDQNNIDEYVLEAMGDEISLKLRKNKLLGRMIYKIVILATVKYFSVAQS